MIGSVGEMTEEDLNGAETLRAAGEGTRDNSSVSLLSGHQR